MILTMTIYFVDSWRPNIFNFLGTTKCTPTLFINLYTEEKENKLCAVNCLFWEFIWYCITFKKDADPLQNRNFYLQCTERWWHHVHNEMRHFQVWSITLKLTRKLWTGRVRFGQAKLQYLAMIFLIFIKKETYSILKQSGSFWIYSHFNMRAMCTRRFHLPELNTSTV